ncbi:peptidylprolyl isomerase [Mycolicibacterium fallax]|uniref:Peptidyl-prolyl cis-trans isomerase n=1 Tax=Mycolicibacterium fallax TaxID=1793 RepID=A0A1X1RH48_MYCFA|nr:peptidylprolyl isomerase [Mycolicibacterium fallax]ORV06172.1 peptidylprolyl isomerase [Mycolicibacterium fallax]HOW93215.1 peptidylprolyl isomerase [Mycolicibacterium fallax]
MSTNEQRRAAAKRKLERQLERREIKAKRQRTIALIAGGTAVVVAVAAVVTFLVLRQSDDSADVEASPASPVSTSTDDGPTVAPVSDGKLPPFTPSAGLGGNCQYPAAAKAAKENKPPRTGKVPTDPATVSASMATNQGNIGLILDNAKSPCTVNSFVSLAQQGYFNQTPCHRLTTAGSLSVLQCGDPTGAGTGGPGYEFANEYPTDQYPVGAPESQSPVLYPRGTLAMANAGPGTNGSQFFLVYQDSQLPPQYTVFGTIDETGLATLDKIAEAGVQGGGSDGKPAKTVTVTSIMLD